MPSIGRVVLVTLLALHQVLAAPETSISCCDCSTLMPERYPSQTSPQIYPSPFKIHVSKTVYNPKDKTKEINVNLTADSGKTFQQFMLQAVSIGTDGKVKVNEATPLGEFSMVPADKDKAENSIIRKCAGNRAVQSANTQAKRNVRLVWTPSENMEGHIRFRATFIEAPELYWVRELSEPVLDMHGPPLDKHAMDPNRLPLIAPIHTIDCGSKKGCYRVPENCWEPYCQYIATWVHLGGNRYMFEISATTGGTTDRYVSLAISDDTRWGNDLVFECVHNGGTSLTQVYTAKSVGHKTERLEDPKAGIEFEEGHIYNGRVRCRFIKRPDKGTEDYPMSGYVHLLMHHGIAENGKTAPHGWGVGEIPVSSPEAVTLSSTANVGDYARYPLVKGHGILMILAWGFFGTIGLLWTKYYKTMWPNKRFYGERYWFVAHFNCMAWLFLFVIIAIILIFIEAGGYSQADYLPYYAHPILGIIILICIILNPIVALLRPPDDHRCRPVFNWIHWFFGTVGWCLAIPNMFIGMDFGKAMVPWWSTWILCIYIIYHIIVEIVLEVHQCCTHKKNKERRKKYEFQKRETPKAHIPEPEPAGRRFKRNMLFAHFIVTCIVAFIMIIAIATG